MRSFFNSDSDSSVLVSKSFVSLPDVRQIHIKEERRNVEEESEPEELEDNKENFMKKGRNVGVAERSCYIAWS